ncbi:hypothetical protein [Agromyces aerolatus]|uniref:hypothetical protein n=1 Tax=Agromyces sp. LY-1074 TaxID=3074080 RepID=UPI0028616A4B|nr:MULTISPECIES: hypothetical protein [unclassified Agromyces]MDR5698870.1 hypothetical protein [Agromyces sp. LY-1074]MDR5705352.1 hypothetical protein [Agromyces sp. LY-1358]
MSSAAARPTAVESEASAQAERGRPARAWAIGGAVAALGSFTSVFLSMMLSPEYIPGNVITADDINAGLQAQLPVLIGFHIVTLGSAMLVVVFAAGLHRRLAAALPDRSSLPLIAFAGMLLVAAAQVFGSGLDTEFLFGVADTAINLPSDIGFYSHWIATIPWLWVGAGLAALAVGVAARARAVARWLGGTSLALGGITVLVALSPLQYMAAGPGILWLLVAAIGFAAEGRGGRTSAV